MSASPYFGPLAIPVFLDKLLAGTRATKVQWRHEKLVVFSSKRCAARYITDYWRLLASVWFCRGQGRSTKVMELT